MLVPTLVYGRQTLKCKEKEQLKIRTLQRENLRGMLAVRRIGRATNERIKD